MKKHTILWFTILVCCFWFIKSTIAQANDNFDFGWLLVYEADTDGKVIYGSLDKLVAAIKDGADVKIQDVTENKRTYSIACGETWLLDNPIFKQPMVGCSYNLSMSVDLTPTMQTGGYFRFQKDLYHLYAIDNSDGTLSMAQKYVDGSRETTLSTTKVHLKWFVRTK
jgi:hypothetical protein